MRCPKCAGLLTQEDIHEHSGRFHGWRCIQCGLRLDPTIVENRHSSGADAPVSAAHVCDNSHSARPSSRSKRSSARTRT